MPTGYTAFIENGTITTAEDFLMLCTRAMGVAITMRDDPLSKPTPREFEPSTYYTEKLAESRKRLEHLKAMNDQEAEQEIEREHAEAVKAKDEYAKRQKELRNKYMVVLDGVKSWNPPTPEHEGLKKFAIEQIEMCLPETSFEYSAPMKLPVEEWKEKQLSSCLDEVQRYKKQERAEIERVNSRNKWLKDLRDSLYID